jgi:SAM-dependent methyltransferase
LGVVAEYFDRLVERAPGEAEPELFELRLGFLLANLRDGVRVLDVGCGAGWCCAALAERGIAVTGVDVSAAAVRLARARCPGVELAVCDEDSLPFGDACFDAVWVGEVLEHVRDGLGLLGEVGRVLVPGGLLVGSVPDHGWTRRLWLGMSRRAFEAEFEPRADHLRFFTRGTLRGLLEAEGFGAVSMASRHGHLLFTARAAR